MSERFEHLPLHDLEDAKTMLTILIDECDRRIEEMTTVG